MKIIFEFDKYDTEDMRLFKLMTRAEDVELVLNQFDNHLRSVIKYESDRNPEDYTKAYEDIRKIFNEMLNEIGITDV